MSGPSFAPGAISFGAPSRAEGGDNRSKSFGPPHSVRQTGPESAQTAPAPFSEPDQQRPWALPPPENILRSRAWSVIPAGLVTPSSSPAAVLNLVRKPAAPTASPGGAPEHPPARTGASMHAGWPAEGGRGRR